MKTGTWTWRWDLRESGEGGDAIPASLRPLIIRQQTLAFLLALLAAWAPVPFGSATVGARILLAVALWILLPLGLACRPGPLVPVRAVVASLVALALLGALQCLPLPRAVVAWLSPARLALGDGARATSAQLASDFLAGEGGRAPSSSIAPELTAATALWLLTLAVALYLGGILGTSRALRRVVWGGLILAGLFQTIYGSGRFIGGTSRIWGVEVVGDPGRFRGTFVNPDHFAFYIGLLLPLVFAWGIWSLRKAREERNLEARSLLVVPPLLIWLALFLGLALSGSRAGIVAALLTVVAQGVLAAGEERHWRYLPTGLVLGVVGVGVVAILSFHQGLGRLLRTSSYEMRWNVRFDVYDASLRLWREFPWVGTGLGTFREAFPLAQPEGLIGTWWHAHNDYLELLVTGGLLGAVLLLLGTWLLVRRLAVVLMDGRRSEDRAAALAALGALVGAAIHSAVDFGLTMPANSLTLALLCGAALSPRVWREGETEHEEADREAVGRRPRVDGEAESWAQAHRAGHRVAARQDAQLEQVKPRLER